MNRKTFERAIHMWPDWSQSIEASRLSLGYDPNWGPAERISWIEANYRAIRGRARCELERLHLPETLTDYWEDCLYNPYVSQDGINNLDRITRRIGDIDEDTGELVPGNKTLPQLPFQQSLVWYEDEDTNDPWLRVEIRIHAGFATKALFDGAAEHAYITLMEHVRASGSEMHPVALNVNKAKVEAPDWVAQAVDVWKRTSDVNKTLHQLYFSDDVQSDLVDAVSVHSTDFERDWAEREFRKRFRDRVMRGLQRLDSDVPRLKSGWWKRGGTA